VADIYETDEVEVEVPGVKREDIDIQVGGQELVISGESKERERAGVLHRGTRRSGRFEHRALLPNEVNAENVNATLSEGVLTVTAPRRRPPSPGTSKSPQGSDHERHLHPRTPQVTQAPTWGGSAALRGAEPPRWFFSP
jgi:HSP20 family protein